MAHAAAVPHHCYPGLHSGGLECYGLAGDTDGGGGGRGTYGLGFGKIAGGDSYGLGAPALPGYNVAFSEGAPGEPTTLTAPLSLALFTIGGAVAGGVVTKSWWGALALGTVGYLAGAGLRATTGLKA